ncbi:hypothetical protein BV898_09840 [Hypsibius exemplaris]|uniref:Uncharacterized protein n=1 Tax=Hypsibius exemplaris TaxID=2072580 RepID=A0A1W0WLI2_HYPEX|nr:hypothetical protein BV898_09840 [Hypsibius exemplaris]
MLLIDALKLAGYGRFHVLYYAITVPLLIICSAHINLNIFIAYDPLHRCKVPDDADWRVLIPNSSWKYPNGGPRTFSACSMYTNYSKDEKGVYHVFNPTTDFTRNVCPNGTEYLQGIGTSSTLTEQNAPLADFGPTIMQELNITCNVNWQWALPGLSALAIWPGQPLALPFMDRIGRKAIVCITMAISSLILAMTPYVGSFWNLWVMRFLARILMQVGYLAVTRHIVELHPMDERHCSLSLLVSGYGAGHVFLAILQKVFKGNWRYVDYAVSVCTCVWTPVVMLFVFNWVWVATSVIKFVSPLYFIENYTLIGICVIVLGGATQLLLRIFKRMELIVVYAFLSCICFFIDGPVNAYEGSKGGYGYLMEVTPSYIARGFFYGIATGLSLSALAIIRMQSAEIRGEECQPGAMFWMLLFGTFGGGAAMYYPKLTNSFQAPMDSFTPLWLTPTLTGLTTFFWGIAVLIWFYDIDYMEDCRWRARFFRCITRRRSVSPGPLTAKLRDLAMRDKRLSITSAAAT